MDFEDSALEFLLEKGFSSEFGARPLKRAIEKYLLAPLAITIVNHNFPSGNQFLLVNAGKQKLKVHFIDPDEPDHLFPIQQFLGWSRINFNSHKFHLCFIKIIDENH